METEVGRGFAGKIQDRRNRWFARRLCIPAVNGGCHGEKTCYGHGFIEEQPDRLKYDDADEQRDPNERENGPVPWESHKAPRNKREGGDHAAEFDEREHRVGVSNVATNGDSACLGRSDAKEETCSEYDGFCHRTNCVLSGSVYEVNCLAMQDKTRVASVPA